MDVALSFDTVAQLLLVVLAACWLAAVARHGWVNRTRRQLANLVLVLSIDTSRLEEAFRRLSDAMARFAEATARAAERARARAEAERTPPDSGSLR